LFYIFLSGDKFTYGKSSNISEVIKQQKSRFLIIFWPVDGGIQICTHKNGSGSRRPKKYGSGTQ
jgi:hypothetical protein